MNAFNTLKHIGFTGDGSTKPYVPCTGPYGGSVSGVPGTVKAAYIKDDYKTIFVITESSGYYYMFKTVMTSPCDLNTVGTAIELMFNEDVWDVQSSNFEFSSNGLYFYYHTSNMLFRNAFVNAWDNPHSNTLIQTSSGSLTAQFVENYSGTPPDDYYVYPYMYGFNFNANGTTMYCLLNIKYVCDSPYSEISRPSIVQQYNLSSGAWNITSLTYAGA